MVAIPQYQDWSYALSLPRTFVSKKSLSFRPIISALFWSDTNLKFGYLKGRNTLFADQ
jgi:hypothetical protein